MGKDDDLWLHNIKQAIYEVMWHTIDGKLKTDAAISGFGQIVVCVFFCNSMIFTLCSYFWCFVSDLPLHPITFCCLDLRLIAKARCSTVASLSDKLHL